uniref:Methionyl-tRNA formyltransferase n=1 Tax=candidate division WOR-3 bacterium TaxID=2052148 RepID=A0A7C2K3X5_UNCW3
MKKREEFYWLNGGMNTIVSPYRWCFLGSGYYAREVLEELYYSNFNPDLVVTTPDKPAGRGRKATPNPVKDFVLNTGISLMEIKKINDPSTYEIIKAKNFDFFVVCDFGKILKEPFLRIAKFPTLNIHPSLLPRYRGPAPIERALMDGVNMTGVTIIEMTMEVDAGPIVLCEVIPVTEDDTKGTLLEKLSKPVPEMLRKVFYGYLNNNVFPKPQSGMPTYAPKISKEELFISWHEPAIKIFNQVRALSPVPGARTYLEGELVKIFKVKISNPAFSLLPGKIKVSDSSLFVGAGDGILEIIELQPASKRIMLARDFVAGRKVDGKFFGSKEVLR